MTNQRKHVSQMTPLESNAVAMYVHSVPVWRGLNNRHLKDRKSKWNLSNEEILATLKQGRIIEAHANNAPDIRIVMRHTIGERDVCVCVSVNHDVITAWVNRPDDNHGTLDSAQYQWKENLVNVFGTKVIA